MKTALVGYTGFVGSNIAARKSFDAVYNSKNIECAYGTKPDLLVYAGVKAEKYLANLSPDKDFEGIQQAYQNIINIEPKKVVLISTIDVYPPLAGADEGTEISISELQPYGANRYHLEHLVKENFSDALIIRLPGLFGKNIKKNFIYDYIHIIPAKLKKEKLDELCQTEPTLYQYYQNCGNGFYECTARDIKEREKLKDIFGSLGFSAVNFTDSRGIYQFYNLKYLWEHIQIALKNQLDLVNLVTEPVSIGELYHYLTGAAFVNEISNNVPSYNFKSKYACLFGGHNGYIYSKDQVLREIEQFIESKEF